MGKIQDLLGDGSKYMDITINIIKEYGPSIIGALVTVWIGFKVITYINNFLEKIIKKSKLDPMLESFITSIVSVLLKVLVLISAAGILGVETTSFIALIGAAGLAVGMALSGTMQNFAGGVMILLFKPYKLGDYIDAGGKEGIVKEIHIFNTIIETIDKKIIIVPNSKISNETMTNYTQEPQRIIDLEVGISYSDDIDVAKNTLKELVKNDKNVIRDDETVIGVKELGDNAVILVFRFYVQTSNYWHARWTMIENIKKTFDAKGLNFPFPQRQIHMTQEK